MPHLSERHRPFMLMQSKHTSRKSENTCINIPELSCSTFLGKQSRCFKNSDVTNYNSASSPGDHNSRSRAVHLNWRTIHRHPVRGSVHHSVLHVLHAMRATCEAWSAGKFRTSYQRHEQINKFELHFESSKLVH